MSRRIVFALCVVFAGLFVCVINNKPLYNWDMLPYSALAMQHQYQDVNSLHSQVYEQVRTAEKKGTVREGTFKQLTKRTPYRQECYQDAGKFYSELTYYRTKPLYTVSVSMLYRAGVPMHMALFIPALAGAMLLLLLFYAWLSVYIHPLLALGLTVLAAYTPMFNEVQNSASPDALSAAFVLWSLYLFNTGGKKYWIFFCLTLAVLARIDNVIPAAVICYYLLNLQKSRAVMYAAALALVAFVCLLIIPYIAGNDLGWFTKFKFLESHVQYYFHVRNMYRELFISKQYLLCIACGLVLLFVKHPRVRVTLYIVLASVLVRLVLFPSLQGRFFIAYQMALVVLAVIAVKQLYTHRKSAPVTV